MALTFIEAMRIIAMASIIHGRAWHATYVLYDLVRDYLACGWMVAIPNQACHINAYGVVMEWRCDCKMPRPPR